MNYEEIINSRFSEPAAVISLKDGRLDIVAMNQRFLPELWMNVSEDDYIDAYPDRFLDEENMDIFIKAVEHCVASGEEMEVETWHHVMSDCCGFDRVCLKSRLILIDKTPDEAFLYESVRNISNEKRAQATLEDVEYRYQQASEQINIYNWEYIIATKEMRPCYRCMRDLGLPAVVQNYPEPAIDMGIFPPDYADMYRDLMRKVDEGIPQIEADIPLTVGRVPFRVKYTNSYDEEGRPVKAFASATLISETELGHIKLDNQIIASLAEEYRCIYLADFVSNTVKTVKQEDIMTIDEGMDCQGLLDLMTSKFNETPEEWKPILRDIKLLRTELFKDSDKREFVYKDEEKERWIRVECQVIERSDNMVDRLLIMVSVVDDLRAQKMDAERLIAAQKEELEDRQKMLLEAVEEANRANKAKTDFFSNMTHDIRTPMNAIMGFSRLAMEEMDNKENLKDYLGKIDSAGDHLLKLINDILDMSRIESGKMELVKAPVRLKELLSECAEMIRVKTDENGLAFAVDVDEMGDDPVMCDKLRFNQVILNLLSNAYKFTPRGGMVSLSGRLLKGGDKLTYEVRVKDTGIGMSEEFRRHIWEAYTRENTEIVHETQGTGLGMVIVGNIINMMHGTIDVKSAPGKGSEFIIELSFDPAGAEDAAGEKDRITQEAMNRDYSGLTVLVVDDTAMNRKLAQILLSKRGFSVITTDNGIDAVEQVKDKGAGGIDIILMDVKMPVMDGLEATRRIRALEDKDLSSIPVIAMTANAFESDIKEALDAGMNDHVPKPFTPEELITVVYKNLRS
ncbi:MAG: response regulator [Lachnospiraceae bacterium]|nr:response regulator [Lachnospiraceae bacterium]